MLIKFFSDTNLQELETSINDFISNTSDIVILDVRIGFQDKIFIAVLLYEIVNVTDIPEIDYNLKNNLIS